MYTKTMRDINKISRNQTYYIHRVNGNGLPMDLLKMLGPELAKLAISALREPAEQVGKFFGNKAKKVLGNGNQLPNQPINGRGKKKMIK